MAGWRYFATRLNGNGTETLLESDLPLQGTNLVRVLSGDNTMSAQIEPRHQRLIRGTKPILTTWSTAIYAVSPDGLIRWGGIISDLDVNGPTISIDAVGFNGYARGMPWTDNGWFGVKVDPLDVVRRIWQHLQSKPGGNLGLGLGAAKVGKLIGTELKQVEFDTQSGPVSFESGPVKLNWYSTHDLGGFIDDLASEYSFDYRESHAFRPDGTIRHDLTFGYPKLGRRRTDLKFIHGVNIFSDLDYVDDGDIYASGVMVLGAGEGAAMVKAIEEPIIRPEGRLRRVKVVTDTHIGATKTAQSRAKRELQWRRTVQDISSVTVRNHPNARLGSVDVGDEIRIEGRGEWGTLDLWVRVTEISWSPDDSDEETYTVIRTDKLSED